MISSCFVACYCKGCQSECLTVFGIGCALAARQLHPWRFGLDFNILFLGVFLYFQVKQMKETADKTLSKVRREIRETRKMLDTVNRLQKLRAVRNDTAEKRGTNVFIIIKGCMCLLTCMLLFLFFLNLDEPEHWL